MKRNCIYKWITKNQPKKDLIIYEYNNPQEYLIHHIGNSCYSTYDKNTSEQIKNNILLDVIWINSNILAIYEQDGNIYLQVNFNK